MSPKAKYTGLVCLALVCAGVSVLWMARPDKTEERRLSEQTEASRHAPEPAPTNANLAETLGDGQGASPRYSPGILLIADSNADYRGRLAASGELSKSDLARADRETLYGWLQRREAEDSTPGGQALKNRVMDQLCEMKPLPDGIGALFAGIYRDQSHDEVIRDYAVQHLVEIYERRAVMGASAEPDLQLARDVLWEALAETDGSIAGTALLGLTRLAEGRPEFDRQRIESSALKLARGEGVGELTRITAFQICGRLRVAGSIPSLLQGARNGQSVSLRISAIGALGLLAGPDEKVFLETLVHGSDARLKLPASRALAQIEIRERNNQK